MITIKSEAEIEYMRKAGVIAGLAQQAVHDAIRPGITTKQLDAIAEKVILEHGAKPNFKGLYGFPATACISVNDCLIHGIPDDYKLQEGDIVSIDLGCVMDGYNSDCARTWPVGKIGDDVEKLRVVTRQSFFRGVKMAKPGNRLGDISHAVGSYAKSFGYGVPLDYTGHGVGTALHEDPSVPNDGLAGHGIRLRAGMTLAVEPMITMGSPETVARSDGWYVRTADHKLCAHYENTFAILPDGPEILTLMPNETEDREF